MPLGAASSTPAVRITRRLGLQGLLAVAIAAAHGWAAAAVDPATVSETKRTKAGLYLAASEVPGFIQAQGGQGACCSRTSARGPKPCMSACPPPSMHWCPSWNCRS